MNNLHRVLVISGYKFDGTDATSITLRNLFSNYNVARIAHVFINYSEIVENSNEKLFVIPKRNFKYFFSKVKNKNILHKSDVNKGTVDRTPYKNKSIKSKIFNLIQIIISSYLNLIPFTYSKQLDSFIRDYKPDLIYTPLGDIPFMKLVLKISKKHKIPIVPHFMDDWMSTKYTNSFLLIIPKLVLANTVKDILKNSKIAFAISEKMANEYQLRFKKQFLPLMNCVEEKEIPNEKIEDSETIRFCYSGGLHLNRWESLLFLCVSIRKFPFLKPIELTVFTKESDWNIHKNKFSNFLFVKYGGFLPHDQILKELNNQNILVHIESFDKQAACYTRLSISTKIPEYLSLKKPILAIGPAKIASIEYLKHNSCAFVVDKQDSNVLNVELTKLTNKEICNNFSKNAYQLFLKNHTQKSQQFVLMNNL